MTGSRLSDAGRVVRTLRALRPIQIAARPWGLAARRLCGLIPSAGAPAARGCFPPAPQPLSGLLNNEIERARDRLLRLPANTLLARYERAYGFDVLDPRHSPLATWSDPAGLHPFPSSVRARNLALACRLGFSPQASALAQASRAVLAQIELHLLGNHLLENGLGLACAGAVTTGAEADLWWTVGKTIVTRELAEQFLPDGGHFERTASYHLWLTAALLEAIELAEASGRIPPASWRGTASRALGWASAVRSPDGSPPLFNDATLDAAPSIDDVLSLGRAIGVEPAAVARVEERAGARIAILPDTGWLIGAAGNRAWLVLDAGPDGAPYQPGHVHADALTFELWVNGERTCVDYGVSSYLDDEARRLTRATRSHNTVELDGLDSCEVWSAFRVGRRASGSILQAALVADGICATVQHDGYRWLPGGPSHRRWITLRERGLTVRDELSGAHEAVSCLRCDDAAMRRVALDVGGCGGEEVAREGAWYPKFAIDRAARVLQIHARRAPAGLRWDLRW